MRLPLKALRSLIIEATKQQAINVHELPSVLYHVTSDQNVASIKQFGLKPRASKSFGYEPRIYVATDMDVALDMFEWMPHPGISELFKITVSLLPPTTVFYDDLAAGKGCYWTPDPIPTSAIEQVPLDD
jgi:hypothetical protein